MKPLFLTFVMLVLLTGCQMDPYAVDRKDYENDLVEGTFRFLFDRFRYSTDEAAYCVVWGYKLAPVPDRFLRRFGDIKREVVSYSDVKTEVVGTDVTFRLKRDRYEAALPVAIFQVILLPPGNDGRKTMEVAWAYRDHSKREVVAVDVDHSGLAKFSVVRDITPAASARTEPAGRGNRPPAP